MKIILNDSDIESMSAELRDQLERFINGSSQHKSTLSAAQIEELWFGINEQGRCILRAFYRAGTLSVSDIKKLLGLTSSRQLAGPMGGISRKIRSMKGPGSSLWTKDKVSQTYIFSEENLLVLREFLKTTSRKETEVFDPKEFEEFTGEEIEEEKTAQWFCLNCHEVRKTYCGTNIKIGNHPQTKGRPCALQIQREMNKAAAEGGWDTRYKTLGCEFKPIAD